MTEARERCFRAEELNSVSPHFRATRWSLTKLIRLALLTVIVSSALFAASSHDPNKTEAIPIVISPVGFQQTSISLPYGSYSFVLLNRTGFLELTVYLERMPGNSVIGTPASEEFQGQLSGGYGRTLKHSRLTPGTYRLRVANRPSWVCAIQVQ